MWIGTKQTTPTYGKRNCCTAINCPYMLTNQLLMQHFLSSTVTNFEYHFHSTVDNAKLLPWCLNYLEPLGNVQLSHIKFTPNPYNPPNTHPMCPTLTVFYLTNSPSSHCTWAGENHWQREALCPQVYPSLEHFLQYAEIKGGSKAIQNFTIHNTHN